jgi:anti-sigma-K factor RskA
MNEQARDLTCVEAEELVAAYVLDALEEQERCAFTGHVAECRLHDEELTALRNVSASLPRVVQAVEPPSALRDRLLGSFDAAVAGVSQPVPMRRPRPRLLSVPTFAYGLAAALLLLAVGLGVLLSTRGDDLQQASAVSDGMELRVLYIEDEQLAVVELRLPPLSAEQTYQAWHIGPAGPASLGLVPNQGPTAFKADLRNASSVAVSVEPRGGSRAPTTTPLLVAEF